MMAMFNSEEFNQLIPSTYWNNEIETGALIQLTNVATKFTFQALIEKRMEKNKSTFIFCDITSPYKKLTIGPQGLISWSIGSLKFTTFRIEEYTNPDQTGCYIRCWSTAYHKKTNTRDELGWCLGCPTDSRFSVVNELEELPEDKSSRGSFKLIGNAGVGIESLFRVIIIASITRFEIDPIRTRYKVNQKDKRRVLTDSQCYSFMQHGYLQIRQVIPMQLINCALRRINHELGLPNRLIPGGVDGSVKLAGNVSNSEDLLSLFKCSHVYQYIEDLLGPGNIISPQGAQIALRFPEISEPRDPLGTEWHTDGMRQGRRHPFTLLVGIPLSDTPEPLTGNFTVFPGSHLTLQSLVQENGKLKGYSDECYQAEHAWGSGTLPDLGIPLQLQCARGDLILAHPALAHRGGLNFSPDIRYHLYFRIKHTSHEELQEHVKTNMWIEYKGLHHLEKEYKEQKMENQN